MKQAPYSLAFAVFKILLQQIYLPLVNFAQVQDHPSINIIFLNQ